jgi:DNA helicase-2/ATP-dependent DNA helicase PcrA
VRTFELRRNYRTPRNVVEHATRLIRNNTWRIAKSPIAVRNDDASIKVVESRTATAEAKMIATALTRIRRNADVQYHDFTVLYRTNAQSLPIQLHFILRNIPYNVREEDNILRNEELEKLLGVLRAKLTLGRAVPVHPRDALLTVKAYFAYVDASAARRLQELFSASPSFLDTVRGDRFFPSSQGRAKAASPRPSMRL